MIKKMKNFFVRGCKTLQCIYRKQKKAKKMKKAALTKMSKQPLLVLISNVLYRPSVPNPGMPGWLHFPTDVPKEVSGPPVSNPVPHR